MDRLERVQAESKRAIAEALSVRGQLADMTPREFVEHVFRVVHDVKPEQEDQQNVE